MYSTSTGSYNTAVGREALRNNTTASYNTALGYQAGYASTTASYNTSIGSQSGYSITTGAQNAFIGNSAGYYLTTGYYNTAVGQAALQGQSGSSTGSSNTAVGQSALFSNTTANYNTALGHQAGFSNTTGTGGTFVGYQAGYNLSTGVYNCFVGLQAGIAITTGTRNTILGGYGGNSGGLDIRTSSNYIVLSDGDGNPQVVIPKNSSGNGYILVGPTKSDPSGGNYYSTISSTGSDVQLILQRVGDAGAGWGGIGASATAAFLVYGQGLTSTPFRINQTDGTVILKGGNNSATGTGINFPATQAASSNANTLDDYEEGTFTPVISGSSSGTFNGYGQYVKIGKSVTVQCQFEGVQSSSISGDISITSMPFTIADSTTPNTDLYFGGVACYGVNFSGGQPYLFCNGNSTIFYLYSTKNDGTVSTLATNAVFNASSGISYLRFSITYITP